MRVCTASMNLGPLSLQLGARPNLVPWLPPPMHMKNRDREVKEGGGGGGAWLNLSRACDVGVELWCHIPAKQSLVLNTPPIE